MPDRATAAHHEAGHPVVYTVLGRRVTRVYICADRDGRSGKTEVE